MLRRVAALSACALGCGTAATRSPVAPTPVAPANEPALRPLGSPTDPASFREVKLADGVYAFVAPVETMVASGNSLLVIGRDGALVVDTHQFPAVARWEIAEIKKLTAVPVRYVVNTHWHDDHWLGNADFRAAWPGVVFLTTPNTRELALTRSAKDREAKLAEHQLDDVRKVLAAGKHGDGRPFSANERTFFETARDELAAAVLASRDLHPLMDPVTFRDAVTIELGGREVDVRFLGRGNTGGDAVVFVPDVKVVATGDLVVSPFPFAFGSFIGEWIETLRAVEQLGATTIVPGHGEIEHDAAYVDEVIAALGAIRDQVAAARAKGLSLEATRKSIDLKAFEAVMCKDDGWCHLGFAGTFVAPAVERAYREAKDGPLHDED